MTSDSITPSLFEGRSLWLRGLQDGFVELCFDRKDASTNKLDRATLSQLAQATSHLASMKDLRGVLVTSAKEVFVVGADVQEFLARFSLPEAEIANDVRAATDAFAALEDLAVPTVAALNGYALGGGLELALACTFRVMSSKAQVGLPETKLGLIPGAGGNVRLPRIAGMECAIDWITTGKSHTADEALAAHVVDAVCEPSLLRDTSLQMLRRAAAGQLDWQARRRIKCERMGGDALARERLYARTREALAPQASQRPAASTAVELMARCSGLERDAALDEELRTFAGIVRTPAAAEMVQAFLDDQNTRRLARQARAGVTNTEEIADET